MRQWRVGSFSMGITLIGLGVILFISQFYNWDVINISILWIPVLLITLGFEILIYIILSRKKQPMIKYDIFSIFFIMFIGIITVSTYTLSSTGIISTIQHVVQAEAAENTLPAIAEAVDDTVDTIVIEPNHPNLTLEINSTDEIHLFGTFRTNAEEKVTMNQVANLHQVGDRLYVTALAPREHKGMGHIFTEYDVTISVPGDTNVEVHSRIHEVNADIENLKADWYISAAENVYLSDGDRANVEVATKLSDSAKNQSHWQEEAVAENESEIGKMSKSFGDGEHKLLFGEIRNLEEKKFP